MSRVRNLNWGFIWDQFDYALGAGFLGALSLYLMIAGLKPYDGIGGGVIMDMVSFPVAAIGLYISSALLSRATENRFDFLDIGVLIFALAMGSFNAVFGLSAVAV